MFEIVLYSYVRVCQAEKRASHIWQRENYIQRYKELKIHGETENQRERVTAFGGQIHKVVCREKTVKRNWDRAVCKREDYPLTSRKWENGEEFLERQPAM